MRTLNHPNIVSFKKLTTTDGGDMCLSMEDCGRSLDNIIHKHSEAEPVKLFTPRQVSVLREEILLVLRGPFLIFFFFNYWYFSCIVNYSINRLKLQLQCFLDLGPDQNSLLFFLVGLSVHRSIKG